VRPLSNLKPNTQFKLEKAKAQEGFVALYNGRVGMPMPEFYTRLIAGSIYPWANIGKDIDKKEAAAFMRNQKDRLGVFLRSCVLRKDMLGKRFEFDAPIYSMQGLSGSPLAISGFLYNVLKGMFPNDPTNPGMFNALVEQVKTVEQSLFATGPQTGKAIATRIPVPMRTGTVISNAIKELRLEVKGDDYVQIWATFVISQKEAEYLNNTPFAEIKLGNFYPTLLQWIGTMFGEFGNVPETIAPIARIAGEVKATLQAKPIVPRTGIDGMIIDIDKNFLLLPEVDQSQMYEQQLMDYGLQDDGSYTFQAPLPQASADGGIDIKTIPLQKKLPSNLPIFTDWLNDKFVYSNSVGNLSIYDLGDTTPVRAFHIRSFLEGTAIAAANTAVQSPEFSTLLAAIAAAAAANPEVLNERPTAEELFETSDGTIGGNSVLTDQQHKFLNGTTKIVSPDEIMKFALTAFHGFKGQREDLFEYNGYFGPRLWQMHPRTGLPAFRFIGRMVQRALEVYNTNIEAIYKSYSVVNTLARMASLKVFLDHGPSYHVLKIQDETERSAYLKQDEIDQDEPIKPIPLIKKDLSFLPHQARVDKKMGRGPKFAMYAVQAGGGKTIIFLTNILRELKNGNCKRPIVLCPSHLVHQYVKEVVFVTEGRLNVLPITNVTMKMHGEEKIAKMIEMAPPNTVVVSDFNFIKARGKPVAYGNKSVIVYKNAEFMRQFMFDLVAVDEVHYLKNLKSARRNAAARFMQDIPMKRVGSGTLIADTIVDIVSQVALLDPTVFGTVENFKREYADEMRGSKVIAWKPGTERMVMQRLKEHCVFAVAKRKEWAALLPDPIEKFYAVDLTENQQILYQTILEETTELIKAALAKKPELKQAMEDSDDEATAEQLEQLLKPYMIRMERFLSAPAEDPYASKFLKNTEDAVSPKVAKVFELCREHLKQNLPGKILIFTQYIPSAEAVYNLAPPDLKPLMVHYTADEKIEARVQFETDDTKRIMVGVSSSMDTGLNFQHVSRLIRMETVWTPGVLEQGNSRIYRPQLKSKETRTNVYLDWILVNRSVDITKAARLVSKLISKAKFDEHDNPQYQTLPDLPQVGMSLESIQANNDFNDELMPYLQGYREYHEVLHADYAAYREEHGDKLQPVAVPQGGMLQGSKLMSRVPYVPEMDLYGASQLGLIRYDEYIHQDLAALESDDDDADNDDDTDDDDTLTDKQKELKVKLERERALMVNRAVHTEFGDGTIIQVMGPKRIRVLLGDGQRVLVRKLQAYVITRSTTSSKDMRNQLLKMVGDIPIDKPLDVPVESGAQDKKRQAKGKAAKEQPEVLEENTLTAEFDFAIINDMLALRYRADGRDDVLAALQNFGFRTSPEYRYTKIPGPIALIELFRTWKKKGFEIDSKTNEMFKFIYTAIKAKKNQMREFGFATKMQMNLFYREQIKPSADPHKIKVYPLMENGVFYIILPTKGQSANQKAARVQSFKVQWHDGGGQDEVVRFFSTKAEAVQLLKTMRDGGITLSNIKELEKQYKSLRMNNNH
jgi:hypothetical protein